MVELIHDDRRTHEQQNDNPEDRALNPYQSSLGDTGGGVSVGGLDEDWFRLSRSNRIGKSLLLTSRLMRRPWSSESQLPFPRTLTPIIKPKSFNSTGLSACSHIVS